LIFFFVGSDHLDGVGNAPLRIKNVGAARADAAVIANAV